MLALDPRSGNWRPLVAKTVATQGEGVSELIAAIDRFDQFRKASPQSLESRKYTVQENLLDLLKERLLEKTTQQNGIWDKIQAASRDVKARKTDPYTAVEEIVRILSPSWQLRPIRRSAVLPTDAISSSDGHGSPPGL